jgi:TPR repeat protein/serine/threonine protein kinase
MDTPLSDSQALPQGTHLQEFVIERVLGSGGFGITYLARDTSLGRQVVIKENLPSQFVWRETATGTVRPRHSVGGDTDDFEWSMQNFLREAETLATMDHSGIVRVLRKFEANGTAYFVMPFVQGIAFDQLISHRQEKNQPFTEEELRGLLERMLDALTYLHDRGIYHRDIKPANILITMEGIPTLIDFGSARQRLSERSMTVIESAGYTPFEQLQSRGNVGPWSDLYAMGATLAKAITGEAPPKAADRVMEDPWPGLSADSQIGGCYSSQFLSSIESALAPLPDHRWQDAKQWQHYLQTGVSTDATTELQNSQNSILEASTWCSAMPEEATPESAESPQTPALWSPNVAADLSLVLLPVFGLFLHARNARALGLPNEEKRNMWWFYGMIAYFAVSMLFAGLGGLLKFYLPVLLVWYFTCGRKQEKLVFERFGDDYPRKSFFRPIVITVVCIFAFVIFLEGLRSIVREDTTQTHSGGSSAPVLEKKSDADIAISYYNRGVEYANGSGVPQNYEEALKWYRKAAELGQLDAMNNIGVCYADGQGVPKDLEESVKWYRKAAEQGSAIAQRNVGLAYLNGEGVSKNAKTAVGWYKKSAMQGDADAQYILGLSYTEGEGVAANSAEAVKWYQEAASQGHSESQNELGLCYENGKGVAKDLFEAVKWYQKSAEQGNAMAQYNLGIAHLKGEGIAKNTTKAFEWIQKSAANDNMDAQFQLGLMYSSGTGITANHSEAAKWFRKTAERGEARGTANLGWCYETGTGVTKDEAEAVKWYRKAAAGDGHAAKWAAEALKRLGK